MVIRFTKSSYHMSSVQKTHGKLAIYVKKKKKVVLVLLKPYFFDCRAPSFLLMGGKRQLFSPLYLRDNLKLVNSNHFSERFSSVCS